MGHTENDGMIPRGPAAHRRGFGRRTAFRAAVLAVVVLMPGRALAEKSALLRSLVIPGGGQVQQGHYARAAIFAGAAVISGVGLLVSSIHYNQSVNKYRQEKRVYLAYKNQLAAGQIVSIDQVNRTFNNMQSAFDQAESRFVWRTTFLVALAATYALNVVDVLVSEPHASDLAQRYTIDADRDRVMLARTFRF